MRQQYNFFYQIDSFTLACDEDEQTHGHGIEGGGKCWNLLPYITLTKSNRTRHHEHLSEPSSITSASFGGLGV